MYGFQVHMHRRLQLLAHKCTVRLTQMVLPRGIEPLFSA